MNRFVQASARPGLQGRGAGLKAQRSGREHADGAGQRRGFVAENIAKQIFGEDHIELPRIAAKLHCAVVDIHMVQREVGKLTSVLRIHLLAPKCAALHHVRLVDRGDALLALAGELERHLANALDLRSGVDLRVVTAAPAVGQCLDAARLAEIDAADQLT